MMGSDRKRKPITLAWQEGFWAAREGRPQDLRRPEADYHDGYATGSAANNIVGELATTTTGGQKWTSNFPQS